MKNLTYTLTLDLSAFAPQNGFTDEILPAQSRTKSIFIANEYEKLNKLDIKLIIFKCITKKLKKLHHHVNNKNNKTSKKYPNRWNF